MLKQRKTSKKEAINASSVTKNNKWKEQDEELDALIVAIQPDGDQEEPDEHKPPSKKACMAEKPVTKVNKSALRHIISQVR